MSDFLEQVFQLYRQAFPSNERRSESDLRSALNTPTYRVLSENFRENVAGFAILFVPSDQPFALLEYLAVDPNQRNKGVGRKLLDDAIELTNGRYLLAEVESDLDDPVAIRRKQFYQSCNFVRISGLKYQLPLPGNPPPMELWINPNPSPPIARDVLGSWLRIIYTDVYGCAADEPRIAEMMARIVT